MNKLNLFIIALMFINCKNQFNGANQFIEFVHTGRETAFHPILFISTKKIDIRLNDQQMDELKSIFRDSTNVTEQMKQDYIRLEYNMIVTDDETLSAINEFVSHHRGFYTNSEHLNNDPLTESYDVIVNDTHEFSIYYKAKKDFFDGLISSLREKKSDPNIIKELSYLGAG